MSLSRATLRARVSGAIGLSNISGSAEQALIDGWLDEAVEQFLIDTKCKVTEVEMALTEGEGDYVLPQQVLAFKAIWLEPSSGVQPVELKHVSSDEIRQMRRWGGSGYQPTSFSFDGADLLRIAPVAVSSTDTLHIDAIEAPAAWTGTGNSPPGIPSWGHPAIEEYAKWKAADWDDDTSSQIGATYMKNYQGMVRQANVRLNKKPGGWAPIKPGGRRRRDIPASPGVDLGI